MKVKSILKVLALYGPQIWIIFFVANIAVITIVRIMAANQTCLTLAQVSADTRCLYIASGSIYQMGSRSSPHHSHPCGMDVTSIIPNSHLNSSSSYLLPNFVGTVCTTTPTPTPTVSPVPTPSKSPSPTPTRSPSPTPTRSPSPSPTRSPSPTPTIAPTGNDVVPTPSPIATPTASPIPGKIGDLNGDGVVNIVDIGIMIDNYEVSPLLNTNADLNGDNVVNIVDIGIALDNYGY